MATKVTVLSVVAFLQGKPLRWQEPWTSPGLYRTSGSLPPPSCTTRRSAHRWTPWAVCITLCRPLWASVGAVQWEPGPHWCTGTFSHQSCRIDLNDKLRQGIVDFYFDWKVIGLKNHFLFYFPSVKFPYSQQRVNSHARIFLPLKLKRKRSQFAEWLKNGFWICAGQIHNFACCNILTWDIGRII